MITSCPEWRKVKSASERVVRDSFLSSFDRQLCSFVVDEVASWEISSNQSFGWFKIAQSERNTREFDGLSGIGLGVQYPNYHVENHVSRWLGEFS